MAPKLFEGLLQWIHKSPTEYFKISRETQQHLLDTVWTTTIRWFGPNYKKKNKTKHNLYWFKVPERNDWNTEGAMNEESSKLLKWPVEITKMLSVTDKWDLCALHFLLLIYLNFLIPLWTLTVLVKQKVILKISSPGFVQEPFIEHYRGQFLGLTEEGKDATSSKRAHSWGWVENVNKLLLCGRTGSESEVGLRALNSALEIRKPSNLEGRC